MVEVAALLTSLLGEDVTSLPCTPGGPDGLGCGGDEHDDGWTGDVVSRGGESWSSVSESPHPKHCRSRRPESSYDRICQNRSFVWRPSFGPQAGKRKASSSTGSRVVEDDNISMERKRVGGSGVGKRNKVHGKAFFAAAPGVSTPREEPTCAKGNKNIAETGDIDVPLDLSLKCLKTTSEISQSPLILNSQPPNPHFSDPPQSLTPPFPHLNLSPFTNTQPSQSIPPYHPTVPTPQFPPPRPPPSTFSRATSPPQFNHFSPLCPISPQSTLAPLQPFKLSFHPISQPPQPHNLHTIFTSTSPR